MDRPSGCTQCHSADLAPGLTPPTDSERLARLEAGLRGLREEYDIWERRAQRKDRCYAFAECRRRLDNLMRRNGISPDGEGTS